jgi:hypothetical protein
MSNLDAYIEKKDLCAFLKTTHPLELFPVDKTELETLLYSIPHKSLWLIEVYSRIWFNISNGECLVDFHTLNNGVTVIKLYSKTFADLVNAIMDAHETARIAPIDLMKLCRLFELISHEAWRNGYIQ